MPLPWPCCSHRKVTARNRVDAAIPGDKVAVVAIGIAVAGVPLARVEVTTSGTGLETAGSIQLASTSGVRRAPAANK